VFTLLDCYLLYKPAETWYGFIVDLRACTPPALLISPAGVRVWSLCVAWAHLSILSTQVGEVTGSRDAGSIDGVRYDHVLPLEVELPSLGLQKLQIGHNNGDNPCVFLLLRVYASSSITCTSFSSKAYPFCFLGLFASVFI
jgi:hypothetical protein